MKAFILAVLLGMSVLAIPRTSSADDLDTSPRTIFSGSKVIPAASYDGWNVTPDFDRMATPTIEGHVTAAGGIRVLIFTDAQLLNWMGGNEATPIHDSGRVPETDLKVVLPGPGTYHVILSNQASAAPVTVECALRMTWQPMGAGRSERPATVDAGRPAEDAGETTSSRAPIGSGLLLILAGAAVSGSVIAFVAQRKRRSERTAVDGQANKAA